MGEATCFFSILDGFLKGVWEKWVFERGFVVVGTWWFGGETW